MKSNLLLRLNFNYKPVDQVALASRLYAIYNADAAKQGIKEPSYDKAYYGFTARTTAGAVPCMTRGYISWGQCEIDLLATDPFNPPVKGAGSVVMRAVEQMAREKDCHRLSLHTYSWQARPFYEKLGFHCFATQHNFPRGHTKFFMEKVFADCPSAAPSVPSGPARDLVVAPTADLDQSLETLHEWLIADTEKRMGDKVPVYNKTPFGVDICDKKSGKSIGGCLYETLWSELRINALAIEPEQRRQGLGKLVLEDMQTMAKEAKCDHLAADVMSYQPLVFFEKLGFKSFGEQKNFLFPGVRKVYLEKIF